MSRESMWDFVEALPPVEISKIVTAGEGWTPLRKLERFGAKLGLRNLFAKLETVNPTGSFKDRAASLGVSLAKQWNYRGVFTASSGNAATSVAAYSAIAGTKCAVLVRENVAEQKLLHLLLFSPEVFKVKDLFSSTSKLLEGLKKISLSVPGWRNLFMWAPVNPLLPDAYKTIAYEIFLSVGRPDFVVVPVAGGDLLYGVYKGFKEILEGGDIDQLPRMVAVQSERAAPLVRAVEQKLEFVPETPSKGTLAKAIDVSFGAEHALEAIYDSRGVAVGVKEEMISPSQIEVATSEGIFCELTSATAFEAVRELSEVGKIGKDDVVVVVTTGIGFKDYRVERTQVPLAELEEVIAALKRVTHGS
ncbi:pyridoxal-phosphate dependent enzyme [Sulfodiicoccus acidiphilus]|uniref:pyridoxal-phosphate dependent enzyme n=1 Tax=Sulfodiicoccus acidiphilus TaxID=1670455 RepID=UPI00166D90D5|nr:pyridoxal-phosphate dependent enzyme [Sulfodiicoccus acidiphilus]